jgi:hypothetical protein
MCSHHASSRRRSLRLLTLQLAAVTGFSLLQADLDPRLVGQWPGHWRGWSRAVAVSENYAFVGADDLLVVDIADPAHPQLVGNYVTEREIVDVKVQGGFAYLTCRVFGYSDLQIVDVSNPHSPQPLGRLEVDSTSFPRLEVSGSHAFVVSANGLEIIDCSNPRRPARIGKFTTSSLAQDVEIVSGYGYLATAYQGLLVLDLSDPANPQLLGSSPGSSLWAITIAGDYALATGSPPNGTGAGLQVFDVTDPTTPRWVAWAATGGFPYNLAVSGNHAYVADVSGDVGEGLVVFDISSASAPRRVGRYDMEQTGGAFDVAIVGSMAAVAGNGAAGLVLLDIRSPDNPQLLGSFQTWGEADDLAIDWPLIFVADHTGGLQIIDASDPSNPRRIGRYSEVGITRSVDVSGHYAFLADELQGLQIVDLSDPAHPVHAARFNIEGYATKVRAHSHYAYVAIGKSVKIVDVGNPSAPRHVSTISTPGEVKDITLCPHRAYITTRAGIAGSSGLHIVDVSDPAQPQTVGYYGAQDPVICEIPIHGVTTLGRYLCLVDSYALHILDVSDPTKPTRLGRCESLTLGSKDAVAVIGNLACVVSHDEAILQIYDISVPERPRPLASRRTSGRPFGIKATGNYVCVADGPAGLKIFQVTNPANPERRAAIPTRGMAVAVESVNEFVYLAGLNDGLYVFDLTNPAAPVWVGWCPDHFRLSSYVPTPDLAVANGRACIAAGTSASLELFDVSNPADPASLATFNADKFAKGVALNPSGNLACVAIGSAGLDIFDISVPAEIKRLANVPLAGDAIGVAITSTHAFVAASETGLHVVDIADPAFPRQVASDSSGPAWGVAIDGRYAYVAEWNARNHFEDDSQGLRVIDIADPTLPRPVHIQSLSDVSLVSAPSRPLSPRHADANRQPCDVAVVGNHVYLATRTSGLLVFDVHDPAKPRLVGGNQSLQAFGVAANDAGTFVAAGEKGVVVLYPYRPIPHLEPWAHFDSTGFRVPFRFDAGGSVRLQRSTDLLTWEDWVILPGTGAVQVATDPMAPERPRQFYRAVSP